MRKYLDEGLRLVDRDLNRPELSLFRRLVAAMDAWFGRHLATFTPASFDVIEAGIAWSPWLRSAVNHSLRALAIPGSFQRDLGCGPLNFAEILFAEFDRCCRDVLLQPL